VFADAPALDPIERTCEILFGLIMVLTFTGSISVAEGGDTDTATVLAAAIGCNLAWGLVDAAMFLIAKFADRARGLSLFRSLRQTREPDVAHRIILDSLPPLVSSALAPSEVEAVRQRLTERPEPGGAALHRADFTGALAVFLLVFLSTFPVVIPFFVVREPAVALRASNAIAIGLLFLTGWSLSRFTGRPGWRSGVGMVAVGVVLVGVTMALGG
jgi:hypothetical protein